jgi:hypothetical protein
VIVTHGQDELVLISDPVKALRSHYKKNRCFTELSKNVLRGVQNRNNVFRSPKPLKVLLADTRAEPLDTKPF